MEDNILKFNEKDLFNNEILHQYDKDGQLGFLGYLLRNKNWRMIDNSIEFPEITSKEKIQKVLKEYDKDTRKQYLQAQKRALERAYIEGNETYSKQLDEELSKLNSITVIGTGWREVSKEQLDGRTKPRMKLNKEVR